MKRKMIWIALVCVAVLFVSIGTVHAYMRKQTEVVENVFVPAKVTCEVSETFNKDNTKTSIKIKNTGNVYAYVRLRFITYWVNDKNEILYSNPPTLNVVHDDDKWDLIEGVYYYRLPVEPTKSTEELLKGSITLTMEKDINGNNKRQVVEVFAEAIQSEPLKAMEKSWGVTVNSEGKIVVVPSTTP